MPALPRGGDADIQFTPSALPTVMLPPAGGLYDACVQTIEYEWDEGTEAVPKAETLSEVEDTVKIVRRHARVGRKVVRYFAWRTGAQPEVPTPDPGNENEVLKSARVVPNSPPPTGEATHFQYIVQAEYVYHLKRPLTHQSGLFIGRLPCTQGDSGGNVLPPDKFVVGTK